jgi:hypothetical protein
LDIYFNTEHFFFKFDTIPFFRFDIRFFAFEHNVSNTLLPPKSKQSNKSCNRNTSSKALIIKAIVGGAVGGVVVLIGLIYLVVFLLQFHRKRKRAGFGTERNLFPETEFSTTATAVSDSTRLPNAMITSSIVSPTSPTSLIHNPLITVVPASPATTTPPREYQHHIHQPEMPDSTNHVTPSQTTPSVFLSSTSSRPLSDRPLSDNQATFLAELLRQGMSASDVPRILEHMGEDSQGPGAHNEITTDNHLPPAYDFKN